MEKKESYGHILPHFQQPGQAYFVTWNLQEAIPKKALVRYTQKLEMLKLQISGAAISESQFISGESEFAAPVSAEIERLRQE